MESSGLPNWCLQRTRPDLTGGLKAPPSGIDGGAQVIINVPASYPARAYNGVLISGFAPGFQRVCT
jgi:hypothetical protein